MKRIILAGGSGFLGQSLGQVLLGQGYEVIILGRGRSKVSGGMRHEQWDGHTPGDWAGVLDGAKAVVNLTGRTVNCRHTPANKRQILESRVNSVRVLGDAISGCANPPAVFVQASSLAIYGNPGDRWCDEGAPHAHGFSEEVCQRWESAFADIQKPGMRKVVLRIGIALAADEGALPFLGRLTRWFLGGKVSHGRQYLSWIHISDLVRMFVDAIERPDLSGVFNASGPDPVTNAEFMRELRRALHRPWSPPVPAWATHIGARLMGTEASLALTGRRCVPRRFLEQGFRFQFPNLHDALANLYPTETDSK